MKKRVVELAEQLLRDVPQNEMNDLIRILRYFNSNFAEKGRVFALRNGSSDGPDAALEKEVQEQVERFATKTAGSQNVYMIGVSSVCRCCGK